MVVVLVALIREGSSKFFKLKLITKHETNAYYEDAKTTSLLSLNSYAQLLDAKEDLNDLSLGLVDQQLDLRNVGCLVVHQILSNFRAKVSRREWVFAFIAIMIVNFSTLPVSKSLETFLNKDIASENHNEVVLVEHLDWPQGRAGEYFKIIVGAL